MKYQEMFSLGDNDSRGIILQMIKPHSKVLEFGCATGNMTRYMTEEMGCDVCIVEIDQEAFNQAINFASNGICGDILEYKWLDKFNMKFDYVIFADVLEHLTKPQEVLEKTKEVLAYDGSVIISVPNIAHNDILIKLYNNEFEYTPTGILDDTHVHFFTDNSLRSCCNNAGYQVVQSTNTIVPTGMTEQNAKSNSKVIENILATHQGGEVYQNIVEIKTREYCIASHIEEDLSSLYCGIRYVKVYFDTGEGYSEENVMFLEATKVKKDCFRCNTFLSLPEKIQKVRIDPLEGGSCLLLDIRVSSELGTFNCEYCNAVESESKILLLDDDPQLEVLISEEIKKLDIDITFTLEGTDSYIEGVKCLSAGVTKEVINKLNLQNEKLNEITTKCNEALSSIERLEEKIVLDSVIERCDKTLEQVIQLGEKASVEKINERFDQTISAIEGVENLVAKTADLEKMYEKCAELVGHNKELEQKVKQDTMRRLLAEEENGQLRSQLDLLQSRLDELASRLTETETKLNETTSQLIGKESQLNETTSRLRETENQSQDYYNRLLERSAAAEYWESYVQRMEQTKSWKITAPLRIPGHIVKTLKNAKVNKDTPLENEIKFSIVMPVYNVEIKWLEKAIESVKCQTYPNWELCITDDASTDEKVIEFLKTIDDNRIKIKLNNKNGGISVASNDAAKMATGQYLLLMDNDDEIANDALMEFYKCIKETNADVVYSDQDIIDTEGNHSCPVCKPKWSPDLFCSQMYLGHLVGFKRELFQSVGGFRKELDGSQDYDLLLRITEKTNKIEHISKVLYSWRALPSSTASNPDSKPYAQYAGLNAIQEHLDRTLGKDVAKVYETDNLFVYDVKYPLKSNVLISIIIPTKDHAEDLKIAIDSIYEMSSYQNFEIIILNNNSEEEETYHYFDEVTHQHQNVRVEEAFYEFNWSKLNNQGIKAAKGEVYLFLNNDVKVLTHDWLERLASQALRPEVGAVGAMLLYDDGTIQHGGVVVGFGGWADHVFKGMQPVHSGTPFISPVLTRNVTAVTGACMAISRDTIEKIGLFDDNFIICGSDVEICIRALQNGLVNVYDPYVRLFHYESKSRGTFVPQIDFELSEKMYAPYRESGDPYYNNNLDYASLIPKLKTDMNPDMITEKSEETNICNESSETTNANPEVNNENSSCNETETNSNVPDDRYMDVGFPEVTPIHFRKVELSRKRLNILLPSLNPEHVFGGIATAYKFFQEMQERTDMDYRIIIVDAEQNGGAVRKYGEEYVFADSQDDIVYEKTIVPFNNRVGKTLPVSNQDYFILTGWWTAYCIQEEYLNWTDKGLNPNPFIYLVQDYEPGFYAWSSHYMLADSTYRTKFEQIAVFNSSELKEYFDFLGYHFDKSYVFEPILNAGLKTYLNGLGNTVKKKKQILIYGRPNTSRNAFALVVEALRKWVWMQEDVSEWRVISAGEEHPKVDLGNGMILQSVGKLTIEEYAKTLEESYAGISLMVSPHPSYPPLEMSVFGAKVITNSYANKDLSKFNDNVISLNDASPTNIANELKNVCDDYHEIKTLDYSRNKEYCCEENSFMFMEELINDLM